MKRSLWILTGLLVLGLSFGERARAEQEAMNADIQAADTGIISIDFKDADLQQVLRVISLKAGIDIVAGPDVSGLVTIKLTNVPWERALSIILRTYGYTYERSDNIVRVMTVEALEREALTTEVFPLDYADASKVPAIIADMLSDRGRVRFDARTNTVIVTDIPSTLYQIREVVKRLDQMTPQVRISAKIIETRLEDNERLGIQWSETASMSNTATVLGSSFPFLIDGTLGFAGDKFLASPIPSPTTITLGTLTGPALSMTLHMLQSRSDTRIVSNPTLAVLDNQEAKIHIGEEYPIPSYAIDPSTGQTTVSGFESRTIGTVLTVTPQVNPSDEVVVKLRPEITSVQDPVEFDTGGGSSVSLPRFSSQSVQTQVRVKNGETIAIGGLVKENQSIVERGVPFLSRVPILGLLFKNTQRGSAESPNLQQDLLVFITVDLMDKDEIKADTSAGKPLKSAHMGEAQ